MSVRRLIGLVLTAGVFLGVGCSRGLPRVYAPSINASAAGAKAIEMYDTNKDGVISGAELNKCPALKGALAQIDTAGEGTITAEKITARIKQWQDKNIGRMQLECVVLRNGQPLAGADVKFVPEAFLGDDIKTATGKTGQNGRARLGIPSAGPQDPRGVALGLYRVEITKAGDNIPARYNTETTLGQEVAVDSPSLQKGLQFNLKY